jgi:hypothetical protein
MIICGLDLSINSPGFVKFVLDDKLEITKVDYLGFNTVKKLTNDHIHYFRKKDFNNNYDQFEFMQGEYSEFVFGSDYAAVEGYSFGSSKGLVFDIAEYCGNVKLSVYMMGIKMRVYEPTTIKLFSTLKGNSNKVAMQSAYNMYPNKDEQIDLNWLNDFDSPKSDIIDAWWIAKLLQTELKLRNNIIDLSTLNPKQQQVFQKVSKKSPENVLTKEFMERVC